MSTTPIASWSRVNPVRTQLLEPEPRAFERALSGPGLCAARGGGRSTGDVAYIGGGRTVCTRKLNELPPLSDHSRVVEVGAGLPLGELQRRLAEHGLHVPVYGGTRWATIGGAIASDIHGKSDPETGSFGCHLESLELVQADGTTRRCSATESAGLFRATVGGMGLTGIIRRASVRVRPMRGPSMEHRRRLVHSVEASVEALHEGTPHDAHYVTWPDLSHRGGVGLGCHGRYTQQPPPTASAPSYVPLPKFQLIRPSFLRLMEQGLRWMLPEQPRVTSVYEFNYAGLHERWFHWNQLFGREGVIAYHLMAPADRFVPLVHRIIALARVAKQVLAMAVLKRFGDVERVGLLSFPRPGYTLNFQVPDSAEARTMLTRCSDEVLEAGGSFYLSKDAVLEPRQAAAMLPGLDAWREQVARADPRGRFSSELCRRLDLKPWAPSRGQGRAT